MNTNDFKLHEVSLFGQHERKLNEFLDTLKENPNTDLIEWFNAFQYKNVLLLTGEKYSYGINFHYNNKIGCPFLIKELDSVNVENCLIGGCNTQIALIVYFLFSKGISCLQTLKDLEKDDISFENFKDLKIKVIDEVNKDDQTVAIIDVMKGVKKNISTILSLSISPNKGKLDELVDALYPMIPDNIKDEFQLMQK